MRQAVRSIAVVLVVTAAFAAGRWTHAQVPVPPQGPQGPRSLQQQLAPTVLAGSDIGFRVESTRSGVPVGRLVVRVDGRWVEPEWAGGVRLLTGR